MTKNEKENEDMLTAGLFLTLFGCAILIGYFTSIAIGVAFLFLFFGIGFIVASVRGDK